MRTEYETEGKEKKRMFSSVLEDLRRTSKQQLDDEVGAMIT
jgi:hypothetical protein